MNPVDPLLFAQYPFCGYSSTPNTAVRTFKFCKILLCGAHVRILPNCDVFTVWPTERALFLIMMHITL